MAMLNPIEPNSAEPVSRRVYRELRSAIVMMRFTPGQALSEQEVASQLGVSRQPVREAFIKLSEAGMVVVRPQRGTYVVKISARRVLDAQFVRSAVERAVVRKACTDLSASGLAELRALIAEQRLTISPPDPSRFHLLDESFHRTLAARAGCEYAWRVVEDCKAQMDRVRYLSLAHSAPFDRLIAQHTGVLDAVEARNADLAETLLGEHVHQMLGSLPDLAKSFPEVFEADVEL
jgi:GntR family transcriptional regulator, rspAB operon transcriptional repressor